MSKSKKLFRWDEIPGEDEEKFIEYLREYFGIDWVKIAQIEKINDIRAIRAFTENKYLFLRLNDEKTKAILTIDDGRTKELAVKSENGELIVYSESIESIIIKILTSISAIYLYIVTFVYYTVKNIEIFFGTAIIEIVRNLIILITIIYISYKIYEFADERFNDLNIQIKELFKYINKILDDEPPQDPTNPITQNLRYRDIEFAIYCLTNKLKASGFLMTDNNRKFDSEKNIIIGIDRGGAVVGGLLGKTLHLAAINIGISYTNHHPPAITHGRITSVLSEKNLDNIDFNKVKKVILVDDAIRTGRTMVAAENMLKKKQKMHNFEYKIFCILCYQPEYNLDQKLPDFQIQPDFFIYKSHDINLRLPWDEYHWDTMKSNKKFDELCHII